MHFLQVNKNKHDNICCQYKQFQQWILFRSFLRLGSETAGKSGQKQQIKCKDLSESIYYIFRSGRISSVYIVGCGLWVDCCHTFSKLVNFECVGMLECVGVL